MRKVTTLALFAMALLAQTASAANSVRISQVYGGGGGSGTYLYDYVELFNSSGSAVNIGGWSIQYGSSAGTSFGSTAANMAIIPVGTTIGPCGYFLAQVGPAGTAGVVLPVTPDFVNTAGPSMSQSAGKVALINNSTGNNACSGNTVGGIYVDVVAYGGNCFETAAALGTSNATVAVRNGAGTVDTDNNSLDITIQGTGVTTIHNSASPQNAACLATPTMPSTWGKIKVLYR
jgi:hypothetical protein